MAESLEITIRANIKQLEKDLKEAKAGLKDLSNSTADVADSGKKVDDSFKGISKSSTIFKTVNEATGGIAKDAVDIINGFKGAATSANLFKAALVSTGIGAIVVAIASIAVYWDDIIAAVNGVNREIARQRDLQQEVVDKQQFQVDILEAQLDTLKLQGKTDKEINELKRERLTALLNEKKALLEIAKTQLESLKKSETASKTTLENITRVGRAAQLQLAAGFDSIFGTNFQKDVKNAQDSVINFLAGTDSKEAQKNIDELDLELIKLQNTIDKTSLADLKIDEKAVEGARKLALEADKAADKLRKLFEEISKDLDLLNEDEAQKNADDVEKIYTESGARIKNALELPIDPFDFGIGDGEQELLSFEGKLRDIRKLLNDPNFNFDQVLSLGQIDEFKKTLVAATEEALIVKNITSNAIGAIGQSLSQSLATDNALFDAFTSAVISTGQTLLQELTTQAIAGIALKKTEAVTSIAIDKAKATSSAVAAGSSTAAAAGPAAAFLLPALVGAAIGFIAASFSGIKFASGGIVPGGSFTGDKVPALLNSSEMVLNASQQANLFKMANGQFGRGSAPGNVSVEVTGEIRGDTILLSSARASRKNKRFNRD